MYIDFEFTTTHQFSNFQYIKVMSNKEGMFLIQV